MGRLLIISVFDDFSSDWSKQSAEDSNCNGAETRELIMTNSMEVNGVAINIRVNSRFILLVLS